MAIIGSIHCCLAILELVLESRAFHHESLASQYSCFLFLFFFFKATDNKCCTMKSENEVWMRAMNLTENLLTSGALKIWHARWNISQVMDYTIIGFWNGEAKLGGHLEPPQPLESVLLLL